jgi:phosphoribosylglycinamide formyltransferase-1
LAGLKTAVLLSGRGTNLQALIDDCAGADAPAEIAIVLSNVPGAAGLKRAEAAGIETRVIDHKDYAGRGSFEDDIHQCLQGLGVELVCLAGFMRILTEGFVARWRDRLVNIHPSLLPAYRGLDTHARALADGVRVTGCTVHFVRAAMDAGPIIVQEAVPVHPGDDAEGLAKRVLAAEHRIYPQALRLIAAGRVSVRDEVVLIDGAAAPESVLLDPADPADDTGSSSGGG